MAGNPAVVLANHYQFSQGRTLSFVEVSSRMLLWCKEGAGAVVVNGTRHGLSKGSFIVLPWGHSIIYQPDAARPYLIGGVHIIPEYAPTSKVVFDVAHSRESLLHGKPDRADSAISPCGPVACGSLSQRRTMEYLAEYAVGWFQRGTATDQEARDLGRMLMGELQRTADADTGPNGSGIPQRLAQLLNQVRHNLQSPIAVRDLADMMGSSPATVTRLFRAHLKTTPAQWVLRTRLDTASQKLMTTDLPVGEVGRQVGIDDPFHFSNAFKRAYGVSPKEHRRKAAIITHG